MPRKAAVKPKTAPQAMALGVEAIKGIQQEHGYNFAFIEIAPEFFTDLANLEPQLAALKALAQRIKEHGALALGKLAKFLGEHKIVFNAEILAKHFSGQEMVVAADGTSAFTFIYENEDKEGTPDYNPNFAPSYEVTLKTTATGEPIDVTIYVEE